MKRRSRPTSLVLGAASLWLGLSGCGTYTVQPEEIEPPAWPCDKVPSTIGTHYSDALRAYVLREPPDTFLLGESTVALVDEHLERIFARRVVVARLPTTTKPHTEVDAILDVDLVAATFWLGNCTPQKPDVFKVAYEVELLAPSGVSLASWRTTGIGSHFCGGKLSTRWPRAQEAMRLALQDALENLSNQLLRHVEDGSLPGAPRPEPGPSE